MKKRIQQETENLKAQLARALADYDNLVKRTEKEKSDFVRYANQNLAQDLFLVIEMLAEVQNHNSDPGIELSISQLKEILKNAGIVEIAPKTGDEFDPEKHEVVETLEKPGKKHGMVAEVVNSGYAFDDGKLIKPAKVRVYGEISGNENLKMKMQNDNLNI